jgi:predicted secreted acid phosphatase
VIENYNKLAAEIKSKISSNKLKGKKARIVFDLDGTLMYYFPRTKQILVDAARMIPEIPEDTIDNIEALDLDDFPYWLNNLLDKIGIFDPAIRAAFLEDWDNRFFTDQYLWADRAMKNAAEFVSRLTSDGAVISYLTGRHRNGMYLGTRASITSNGFPFYDDELGILMKPLKEHSNALFKREAAAKLAASGEVIAIFDNEPQELAYISSKIVGATPALYISPCSTNMPLGDSVFRVRDYAELIKAWDNIRD